MKEVILSKDLPTPAGPYSQAVKSNGLLFTSGQLPIDPVTGELELNDVKKAAVLCLDAIEKLAKEVNSTKNDIVKVTILLADIASYADVNATYSDFFEGCVMPARTAYAVQTLPLNSLIEIEAIIEVN